MSITDQATLQVANWIETQLEAALGVVLQLNASGPKSNSADLMHWTGGKLFEFFAFVKVLNDLKLEPGVKLTVKKLHPGNTYLFNGGPGQLHPDHSHVAVQKGGAEVATVWQNVEFTGIGFGAGAAANSGEYHEADVIVLQGRSPVGPAPLRPNANQILLAMECKFTADMPKTYLRNMLGLRRVMSYVQSNTHSPLWHPSSSLSQDLPASRGTLKSKTSHLVLAYSFALSGRKLGVDWSKPAQTFGIEYWQC